MRERERERKSVVVKAAGGDTTSCLLQFGSYRRILLPHRSEIAVKGELGF
jgi:hypothetical protein